MVEAIWLLVQRPNVSTSPDPALPMAATIAERHDAQEGEETVEAVMTRVAATRGVEWIGCTVMGVDAADVVVRNVGARLDPPA